MANQYTIRGGMKDLHINKTKDNRVDIKVGDETININVNDLAWAVKECLPVETAQEMFGNVDEKQIQSGKVKVKIRANYDIKKGDYIVTSLDINKYLDSQGKPTGIRTTKWGFAY